MGSFGEGAYSLADLILLNSLPDGSGAAYQDNHPVVRPLIFTGRTIGAAWKTTEEAGNALTWGYFDNVTGCLGMVIEDLMELLKHAGQAATNLVRAPVHLVAGDTEETNRAMDWVLLVPLEFLSNAAAMKGISNMQDYETAFEDKGVIGSLIEFGGSGFLVYRSIDKALDELDDNHHDRNDSGAGGASEPDTPPDTTIPELPPDLVLLLEGEWPIEGGTGTAGLVLIDGVWTIVKTWRQ
ncbi:MAG: hypothetical protein A2Y77_09120 [Planctomycetes bacterium RBG_13_62_9]|nr:MAG: hypothetical protein A2Y77_09120 [Planctomycetes bacterium RBG_13_62_9]